MKTAIVHDFLNQYGGAEKVVEVFHAMFPRAPVYTSIYLPENLPENFRQMDIRTSFMQNLPFINKHFKKYVPLYPRAIESFDLSDYDLVLSSSSAFAKGARPGPRAAHVCYCYSPMRYVWDQEAYFAYEPVPRVLKPFLPPLLARLKKWDRETTPRVGHFIAISEHIRRRIQKAWGREAEVIYPPVDTTRFSISREVGDSFFMASRLVPYKKIELAIEAFNKLGWPLRIAGAGPQETFLKKMAKPNVQFLGRISDEDLARELSDCRGFIFPSQEDFGIAPVEAMAAGRPVVAFAAGGALETVVEGKTGVFFRAPNADALASAVVQCREINWDAAAIKENARRFDREIFEKSIQKSLDRILSSSPA